MDENIKIWTKNRKYGHKIWKYGHNLKIWKNMENMDIKVYRFELKPS